MTNMQIIFEECILNKVTEPVNTYAGWQRAGWQVKKGSKALFKTSIWKPSTKKAKITESTENVENDNTVKMIIVSAAFFGLSQTEIA